MARRKQTEEVMPLPPAIGEDQIVGVDVDPSIYELTDLFCYSYRYHNEECEIDYDHVYVDTEQRVNTEGRTISRFEALRRIQASLLGSRPYLGGTGLAAHKPNRNLGYMSLLMEYLKLPIKSIFSENQYIKVQIDKRLKEIETLSDEELVQLKMETQEIPGFSSNKEISDDTSDALSNVFNVSKAIRKCNDETPMSFIRDAFSAFLHSDVDWAPEPMPALDLVTEPQADWDSCTWSYFFVIKRISANKIVEHIRNKTPFWNIDALKWALENSRLNRSIIGRDHYYYPFSPLARHTNLARENFMVKSFYRNKTHARANLQSYYGNLLVVEAYYLNKDQKVDKAIFFPSLDFKNVPAGVRNIRANLSPKELDKQGLKGANILFYRQDIHPSMSRAITIVPSKREERSLERQRSYGHELFAPIEEVMRLDSSISYTVDMMSAVFYKNRASGKDAQDMEDLEVDIGKEMIDLGDRDIVETPFSADLNAMAAQRQVLLQHAASKSFLGGLDGGESTSEGRGANLANLRLVRDGRVHKHVVEDFATGMRDVYINCLRGILDIVNTPSILRNDTLISKLFIDKLCKEGGHKEEFFKYDKKDILEDTDLPYWMDLQVIRNGGSHFGAAELVLYSEIKQVFGDGLDQQQLSALNRMGIKSLLGYQDAIDILGDPKEQVTTDIDQVYQAKLENAAIVGSVDQGGVNFEEVTIRPAKDDSVIHLTQAHNPKMQMIIQKLQEGDFTPDQLQQVSEQELETRSSLILKLAALSHHAALHQNQLSLFGKKRQDINKLKEETNALLQTAEGYLNSLQMYLQALQTKRQETLLRLQNISPENEAEKAKQQVEMMKIQAQQASDKDKLLLANKLADLHQQQHIDKQLTKAKDRQQKALIAERQIDLKRQEIMSSNDTKLRTASIDSNTNIVTSKIASMSKSNTNGKAVSR